jgi:hypothetical protein
VVCWALLASDVGTRTFRSAPSIGRSSASSPIYPGGGYGMMAAMFRPWKSDGTVDGAAAPRSRAARAHDGGAPSC